MGLFDVKTFDEIKGKTLVSVEVLNDKHEINFVCSDGSVYLMHHVRDCCESVTIDDITGDLSDLLGSPILEAEERTHEGESTWGHSTWTFYVLSTFKGSVTIRWFGESNGYYSEAVYFELMKQKLFML